MSITMPSLFDIKMKILSSRFPQFK